MKTVEKFIHTYVNIQIEGASIFLTWAARKQEDFILTLLFLMLKTNALVLFTLDPC